MFVLMSELAAAGVIFTEMGVEFRQYPPQPYTPTTLSARSKEQA